MSLFTAFRVGFRAGYKNVAQPNKHSITDDKKVVLTTVPAKIGKVVGTVARGAVKVLKGLGTFLLCVGEANQRVTARKHEAAVAETSGYMGIANALFDRDHFNEQVQVRETTAWSVGKPNRSYLYGTSYTGSRNAADRVAGINYRREFVGV